MPRRRPQSPPSTESRLPPRHNPAVGIISLAQLGEQRLRNQYGINLSRKGLSFTGRADEDPRDFVAGSCPRLAAAGVK